MLGSLEFSFSISLPRDRYDDVTCLNEHLLAPPSREAPLPAKVLVPQSALLRGMYDLERGSILAISCYMLTRLLRSLYNIGVTLSLSYFVTVIRIEGKQGSPLVIDLRVL